MAKHIIFGVFKCLRQNHTQLKKNEITVDFLTSFSDAKWDQIF